MKIIILNQSTNGKFKEVVINNRPHLVTDVVAVEFPSVMNRILYPESLFNSALELKGKLAPASHPKVNGVDIEAGHPLSVNAHNIGAFVLDVTLVKNQAIATIAVDIEVAEKDERGVEIMRRIKNAERIGMSTGLPWDCREEKGELNGREYDFVLNQAKWDHLAFLLNEKPAGENTYSIVNCNVDDFNAMVHTPKKPTEKANNMDKLTFIKMLIANAMTTFFPSDEDKLMKMNELQLVNALQENLTPKEITVEDATDFLKKQNLVVNSQSEVEQFQKHSEEFKRFLNNKKEEREKLIESLINNSKLTKEKLESFDDDTLADLKNSLAVNNEVDYSTRGSQIVNERVQTGNLTANYS